MRVRFIVVLLTLWLAGIVLAAATVTFAFWQLGWATISGALNLLFVCAWLAFAATVATCNRMVRTATSLVGVACVPLISAVAMMQIVEEGGRASLQAHIAGGICIFLMFVLVMVWAFASDLQNDLSRMHRKQPRFA